MSYWAQPKHTSLQNVSSASLRLTLYLFIKQTAQVKNIIVTNELLQD